MHISANKMQISNPSALNHHDCGYTTSENDIFCTLLQQSNAIKLQIKYIPIYHLITDDF